MKRLDAAELEIFKNVFHSIAEEMGAALRRSAFSPNIKERRDYSCAVFDGRGRVVAMGDHMPVHLGSMPASVAAAIAHLTLEPGDIAILNDPFAGGTHLPDVTMVSPVFIGRARRPRFYVANRAHHSDIGGAQPASMGLSEEIYQEGIRIPPVKLVRRGALERDVLALLLANVRTPREREGDFTAQIAASRLGQRRLEEVCAKYGAEEVSGALEAVQRYAATLMEMALRRIPDGTYRAMDCLDDDGFSAEPVPIRITIRKRGAKAAVDFTGTAPQCRGSVNAVESITQSCVFYAFRCVLGALLKEDAPASAGLLDPIEMIVPKGTVVAARPPAAVSAGNVETSQRIVDVLFLALAKALPEVIPAASQGTMNNLSFGGIDPRTGEPFAYYETVAGGMGARPTADGLNAVHTHMTNSLNTPIEAFESAYPVRVRRYAIRHGSGGTGKFPGGDGVVRELEFLTDVRGTILSDRRRSQPYGLTGGKAGKEGTNEMMVSNGEVGRERVRRKRLPSKCSFEAAKGSKLIIRTPGGGGWGIPKRSRGYSREVR
jgi:N-methylhydantoinase B